MRPRVIGALAVCALLSSPAATAKDFRPGDLRVCNASRCVPVVNREATRSLASLYYTGPQPSRIGAARLGAPYYELRSRNGYVTGIVATDRLDRFLSYGVVLERFVRGRWYSVPRRAAQELRRLTAGMKPGSLTRAALAKSR